MVGLVLALVVVGIVFLFVIPWVGVVVGLAGLALGALWLLGFGRGLAGRRPPGRRP